jgi:hypothetical protein
MNLAFSFYFFLFLSLSMLLDPDPEELNQYGIQEDPNRKRMGGRGVAAHLNFTYLTGRELACSLEESCLMAWK